MYWLGKQLHRTDRCGSFICTVAIALGAMAPSATAEAPADRLLDHLEKNSDVSADAIKLMRNTWENCDDCDGEEFLLQALSLFEPAFCDLLDTYDREAHKQGIELAEELRWSEDPFVAANAAAYQLKSMIVLEQFVEAGRIVDSLLADGGATLDRYTYLGQEVRFLKGFTLLTNLKYEEARQALQDFVDRYPEGSPRLVFSARQMLAELANREADGIGEVVDLMDYSRRRLAMLDSGDPMQDKQRQVIALLDNLIEEAEEQEKKGGGGGGGSGKNSSQQQQKGSPKKPMNESSLPGGQASGESLRNARRASPAEVWGTLPPDERDKILQALRENFPSRYRKLVEQYYEELAKKP